MRSRVVILGGGPAGLATAISLRRNDPEVEVLVIERSDYQNVRIGETLPPTAEPLLRQLGVWEIFLRMGHQAAYSSESAWGSSHLQVNEFLDHPYHRGWHLDRRSFDRMLAEEAVRNGVLVWTASVAQSISNGAECGRDVIARRSDGTTPDVHADFVVDATGRRAEFAVAQGAHRVFYDRLLAIMGFLDVTDAGAIPPSTLIETWEDGWWYTSRIPGNQLVVACMTDNDIASRHRLRLSEQWWGNLRRMPHTFARVNAATSGAVGGQQPVELQLVPASSSKLDQLTGDDWLAVGDAATTFDPLSSLGVFKALRSGILASYAILDRFGENARGLERYEHAVQKEFDDYLDTRASYYSEEQRWPESTFWSRRRDFISLDPMKNLVCSDSVELSALARLPFTLRAKDMRTLCMLCERPVPAFEVVASFVSKTNGAVSDTRVIIALQQLIEHGVLLSN